MEQARNAWHMSAEHFTVDGNDQPSDDPVTPRRVSAARVRQRDPRVETEGVMARDVDVAKESEEDEDSLAKAKTLADRGPV